MVFFTQATDESDSSMSSHDFVPLQRKPAECLLYLTSYFTWNELASGLTTLLGCEIRSSHDCRSASTVRAPVVSCRHGLSPSVCFRRCVGMSSCFAGRKLIGSPFVRTRLTPNPKPTTLYPATRSAISRNRDESNPNTVRSARRWRLTLRPATQALRDGYLEVLIATLRLFSTTTLS